MFDQFTDFTPAQAKMFHDQFLGDTYQYFLKIVAASRNMNVEQVDQIAQGRVWTGSQALKIKLVDSLGGLDDALAMAKTLARIPTDQTVPVVELPTDLLERASQVDALRLLGCEVGQGFHLGPPAPA